MSETRSLTLDTRRYVTISTNLLHAAFIKAPRAQARRHFARIHGGGALDLGKMSTGDGGEVMFRLALDHSEFRGKIGFPAFRSALHQLLGRLAERVRLRLDIPVYSSEQTGELLFNVPAVVTEEGRTNMLMLGVGSPQQGVTTLKLQYLNPEQFRQPVATPGPSA